MSDPGKAGAGTHLAYSEAGLSRISTAEKRAFLRSKGVRLEELDKITAARLDQFARMQAKVVLLDRYLDEHGLLDESGETRPAAKLYPTIHNSAQRALDRLEVSVRAWQQTKPSEDPWAKYKTIEAEEIADGD